MGVNGIAELPYYTVNIVRYNSEGGGQNKRNLAIKGSDGPDLWRNKPQVKGLVTLSSYTGIYRQDTLVR
jgi:hypothetical protein